MSSASIYRQHNHFLILVRMSWAIICVEVSYPLCTMIMGIVNGGPPAGIMFWKSLRSVFHNMCGRPLSPLSQSKAFGIVDNDPPSSISSLKMAIIMKKVLNGRRLHQATVRRYLDGLQSPVLTVSQSLSGIMVGNEGKVVVEQSNGALGLLPSCHG